MGSLCTDVNLYAAVKKYKSDQSCHGNATVDSLCIDVKLYVAVNNTNAISVAMETQQWVPSVLMITYMQL